MDEFLCQVFALTALAVIFWKVGPRTGANHGPQLLCALKTKAGVGAEPFRACTEHAWLKTGASLHPEPQFCFGMD